MENVTAPERCQSCVFLSMTSGKAYCPFSSCIRGDAKKTAKNKDGEEEKR